MKKIILSCALVSLAVPSLAQAQASNLPSNDMPSQARAGQCYERVLRAATYRDEPVSVVKREGYERLEALPPKFQTDHQTIVVVDPSVSYVVTPPQFRTETQTIVTRPAHERLEVGSSVFGTKTERVLVREPRLVWRSGSNLSKVRRLDPRTGEVFCLVEETGLTETVSRTVMLQQAPIIRRPVPAETKIIERKILVANGSVREVPDPGKTETVAIHSLVREAEVARRSIDPEYTTINRQVIENDERYEWVPVVCETAANASSNVVNVQRALAAKGFYRGPVDGIMGAQTRQAIRAFQREHRLSGNGALTIETTRHLGL